MKKALAVSTVGPSFSPQAYTGGDSRMGAVPAASLATHEFIPLGDGRMEHRIDGELRATVPPEGMADYARTWPDCAELAATLRAADR